MSIVGQNRAFALAYKLASAAFSAVMLCARTSFAVEAGDSSGFDEPHWSLESTSCDSQLVASVEELLRIELVSGSGSKLSRVARIELVCSGGRTDVFVEDIAGRELTRQIELDRADAKLHARIIALATAELVREQEEAAEPEPAPPQPKPKRLRKPIAESSVESDAGVSRYEERRPRRILAFASISNFGMASAPLVGGGLGFDFRTGSIALGLGSAFALREQSSELGTATVSTLALDATLAWVFDTGPLALRIGAGHSFGAARISGTASDAQRANEATVTGAWAAPFAMAAFAYAPARPLVLELRAQLGWVTLPVTGRVERGDDASVADLWSMLQFGVGIEL